jgi:xylan 1,4-beta-xylosidase
LLHRLGDQRVANAAKNAIVTRLADGSLEVAVWNPVENEVSEGPKEVSLQFSGIAKSAGTSLECVDDSHSNPVKLWQAMGSPVYPKPDQVEQINRESALPAPERRSLINGTIHLDLERNALCLLHVGGAEQAY